MNDTADDTLIYRAELIDKAMRVKDLTNDKVAEITGLSVATVSSIRNGSPSAVTRNVKAVADAVGVTMAELFTPKTEAEPAKA